MVVIKLNNKTRKNTNFCIVAMFKNEAEIFNEWLKHYINEGCDHFFLINNGSTDNFQQEMKEYNDKITLFNDDSHFDKSGIKHNQARLYNKYCFELVKKYEWVLVCDLDEFVYARGKFNNITEYLNSVETNVSSIAIPWKIFGSNGYNAIDKKEPPLVIPNFTKRINYDTPGTQGVKIEKGVSLGLTKCITRTSSLKKLGIHRSSITKGIYLETNNTEAITSCFAPISEKILEESVLHLNHYPIRSLDFFTRIKMTRGAANSKNVRNLEYYYNFDKVSNDICDFELSEKKY